MMGLQKFCTLCGSLRHAFDVCTEAAHLSQRQYELMDIGINPYVTVQERKEAIDEYKTIKEAGETSATMTSMHTETAQVDVSEATVGHITFAQKSHNQQVVETETPATQPEQGTKRKSTEEEREEASVSKRIMVDRSKHGLVVIHKPPPQP